MNQISYEDLFKDLKAILYNLGYSEDEIKKINFETRIGDHFDDLDLVEIVIEFEKGFNIIIDDDSIFKWVVIDDMITRVRGLVL
jgi:acyl carrier protein